MIVVDVNIVAYLLLKGEYTTHAEAVLRHDPEWAAPLLWRSEWNSVLAGYMRRGEMAPAVAVELAAAAADLLRGREHLIPARDVLEVVEHSTLSAYDAEYVALAETLDVPLITADRQVLRDYPERAVSVASFDAA